MLGSTLDAERGQYSEPKHTRTPFTMRSATRRRLRRLLREKRLRRRSKLANVVAKRVKEIMKSGQEDRVLPLGRLLGSDFNISTEPGGFLKNRQDEITVELVVDRGNRTVASAHRTYLRENFLPQSARALIDKLLDEVADKAQSSGAWLRRENGGGQVHAKHPNMALRHGGSPKGAELIAANWAAQRRSGSSPSISCRAKRSSSFMIRLPLRWQRSAGLIPRHMMRMLSGRTIGPGARLVPTRKLLEHCYRPGSVGARTPSCLAMAASSIMTSSRTMFCFTPRIALWFAGG